MDLDVEKSEVNIVNWLTYHWMRKKGVVGMDKFAGNAYGMKSELQLCEASNDAEYYFEVTEKKEIDDPDNLEEILKTEEVPIYDLHILLQDMVNKDMLPAGNYLIRVSW